RAVLQSDVNDVFERRSAACAYEQERARRIIRHICEISFPRAGGLFISMGNPRCRSPLGALGAVDLRSIFRKWQSICAELAKDGWAVKAFAIAEIHLARPCDGPPFWEPHLHGILAGAPAEAVNDKCRIRHDASFSPSRTRHRH